MKKLRIAIVADLIPGQPGGSFFSTLRFAELLNKRGHNVVILSARTSKKENITKYRNIKLYPFFSLPIPGSKKYYYQSFPTKKKMKKIFINEKIDIVHIMFASYSCYLAIKVAKEMNIPMVAHAHTQPENILIFLPKFLRGKFITNIIYKYLIYFLKPSKKIISPSMLGKNIFKDHNPQLDFDVISNGVDLSQFKKKSVNNVFKKFKLDKNNQHLLFISRLTPEKEPTTLIQALSKVINKYPQVHLLMIGVGPLEIYLKKMSKELNILDKISFLGKVSDEDLLACYNISDLFILPSLVELEGMVVLEAMACSKPIIVANADTSASKYFVNGNGYLFKPKDSDDLAKKILKILKDDNLRLKMSLKSYEDAKKYDIHQSILKLEKLYYNVLEKDIVNKTKNLI